MVFFPIGVISKFKQLVNTDKDYLNLSGGLIMEISKSSMIISSVAASISIIAAVILKDVWFLSFGLISLPAAVLGVLYINEYKLILNDLSDRDKMVDIAKRVAKSGSEIVDTANKLDQELLLIKEGKENLEKQLKNLKEENDRLIDQLELMKKIGGNLTQTHADFSSDFESIVELEDIIKSNFLKMRELVEQERMKEEDDLSSIRLKAKKIEERLKLIYLIYERTNLFDDLQRELIKLNSEELELCKSLCSKVPSLNKLLTKR